MRLRNWLFAEGDMTLCANKFRIGLALVDLVIQSSTVFRFWRRMACCTRRDRYLHRAKIRCIHLCDRMARRAFHIHVPNKLMLELTGRVPGRPGVDHRLIGNAHLFRE